MIQYKCWFSRFVGPKGQKMIVGPYNTEEEAADRSRDQFTDHFIAGYKFVAVEQQDQSFDEVTEERKLLDGVGDDFNRWVTMGTRDSVWENFCADVAKRNNLELWRDEDHFDSFLALSRPGKYEPARAYAAERIV